MVVKVGITTICGTDLHILQGDVPAVTDGRILGHEAVGTITAIVDASTGFAVGDRVLVPAITKCGRCEYCQRGMPSHCQTVDGIGWIFGHLIDGTRAEYVRVPYADTSLYAVPPTVSDEQAIFLADSLPTGYEVGVLAGGVRPGDTVAVVGAGAVGPSAVLTTGLRGASKAIAIDSNKFRLEKALEFGATDTVEVGPGTASDVTALADGLGVDVAIEAVGYPETLLTAASLVRPGGTIADVGVHGTPVEIPMQDMGISNVTLTMGPVGTVSIPTLPKMVASGRIPATKMGTHGLHLRPDGRGLRRVQERGGQPGAQGRHHPRLTPIQPRPPVERDARARPGRPGNTRLLGCGATTESDWTRPAGWPGARPPYVLMSAAPCRGLGFRSADAPSCGRASAPWLAPSTRTSSEPGHARCSRWANSGGLLRPARPWTSTAGMAARRPAPRTSSSSPSHVAWLQ